MGFFFSWVGKAPLACISLAMLAICLDMTGTAALTIFGGIASTPVAFLGSSLFIHFFTCVSVTGTHGVRLTFQNLYKTFQRIEIEAHIPKCYCYTELRIFDTKSIYALRSFPGVPVLIYLQDSTSITKTCPCNILNFSKL